MARMISRLVASRPVSERQRSIGPPSHSETHQRPFTLAEQPPTCKLRLTVLSQLRVMARHPVGKWQKPRPPHDNIEAENYRKAKRE
jgi:hypothetical protein